MLSLHRVLNFATSSIRCYCYKSVRRPDLKQFPKQSKQIVSQLENEQSQQSKTSLSDDLSRHIQLKIRATGPITLAEYMREVLTNPAAGYYMNRDVFGREGDFITSPEISQIFGELVGVWIVNEWRKLGSPTPFQLIELGPGRGTLARDVLKVLCHFNLVGQFSIHLVEISPHLSQQQAQLLCYKYEAVDDNNNNNSGEPFYQYGETATGTKVYWYRRLEQIPQQFSIVLAHEFFDALPVHKLQRDGDVWKEVLVDVADNENSTADTAQFRFVLSKTDTLVSRLYRPIQDDLRQCLEYSLDGDQIIQHISERFERDGGMGLIMDYGHYGDKTDTFRGFKRHQLHDPLKDPGTADLTADVDFQQLQRAAEERHQVVCFGPVEQGIFLKRMEGDARMQNLLKHALPENHERIQTGYKMLTDPDQMGKRFKFFCIFPAVLRDHLSRFPVHGFH